METINDTRLAFDIERRAFLRGMTTYSCRAELAIDAIRVLSVLYDDDDADARLWFTKYDGETQGLEFMSTHSIDALLALFARVADTHIMRGTLRAVPLAENSLDY